MRTSLNVWCSYSRLFLLRPPLSKIKPKAYNFGTLRHKLSLQLSAASLPLPYKTQLCGCFNGTQSTNFSEVSLVSSCSRMFSTEQGMQNQNPPSKKSTYFQIIFLHLDLDCVQPRARILVSIMAQKLAEKVLLWLVASFYGLYTLYDLMSRIFKIGFKKLFHWKVTEKPACLDDECLGTHGYLHLEDVRIHYVASGPEDKPLMLFMHGFPEFWFSWRHQIKEFQKDYRVVAFDMRGYNKSDKPTGLAAYSLHKLMADVKQVILALGYKSCILVAHDWGGGIAWAFGRLYPDFVDKLIIMNAPPGTIFQKLIKRDANQRKMSWYMFFFQLPFLPELMLRVQNFNRIEEIFKTTGMNQEEVNAYKHVFSQPGALTPPLNYYRSGLQRVGGAVSYDLNYAMPVLLIWGCADVALSTAIPDAVEKENPKIAVRRIQNANHFVQNNDPKAVNKIMREWLNE
ncbi:hypothetical protein RRG08_043171 [Elysia crispata]|uniref:AB hydrolase-1 domain-containing protein n=1 Tax=Elysia crispata TaxID=231223 RepID=A0AAE1DGN7_9GAST|nr:hypothetical protein RRG08_043171 [Elysia crispata]